MSSNFWGAALAVLAAILSNIGTNAQKHSHMKEDELPANERRPYIYRGFWWIGFCATLAAAVGDFLALALASQALVSALGGGTTLVTNVLVARIWNKDQLVWSDMLGVIFIVGGATYFAVTTEPPESLDDESIKANFQKKWFLVYLCTQLGIIIIMLACIANSPVYQLRKHWTFSLFAPLVDKIKAQEERLLHLEAQNATFTSVLKQLLESSSIEPRDMHHARASIMQTALPPPPSPSLLRTNPLPKRQPRKLMWYDKYTYAACAGTIGGLSVLFGSCTGKSLALDGFDAFEEPAFYAFLISMLICVVVQTHLLNESMQLGGTMAVFPVFEAFWISFGVFGGLVFYNTSEVSWGSDIKQGSGALFMMIGVAFLMMHPENDRDKATFKLRNEESNLDLELTDPELLSHDMTSRVAVVVAPTWSGRSGCTDSFNVPSPERIEADEGDNRLRHREIERRKIETDGGGQPLLPRVSDSL